MKPVKWVAAILLFYAVTGNAGPAVSSGKRILFEVRCVDRNKTQPYLNLTACKATSAPQGISLRACRARIADKEFTANYFIAQLPQSAFRSLVITTNKGQVNVMAAEVNSTVGGMSQFVGKMSAPEFSAKEISVDCFVK